MDRNNRPNGQKDINRVALRKESVDRNGISSTLIIGFLESLSARRAWIEINVLSQPSKPRRSLSARRAWIEMISGLQPLIASLVALRKESVDRNSFYAQYRHLPKHVALRKESVDRNSGKHLCNALGAVALRKESVDRNGNAGGDPTPNFGRSPQGERG